MLKQEVTTRRLASGPPQLGIATESGGGSTMASTDGAPEGPRRTPRLWRRLLRAPLFAKVLLANGVVVALGATAGTYLTAEHVRRSPHATNYEMVALFAAGGLALSLLLNAAVLRTALRPLARLERAARRVREGDLGARVRPGTVGDPATDRLAAAFNAMLDGLRERTRQVEAYSSRLQELCDRVLLAQEEERARLASRLLDEAGQELATLLLHLRLLQNAAARPGADAAALGQQAAGLTEQVRATLDGVRRLAADLRPRLLDDLGLEPAVRSLVREWGERTGIPVDLRASLPPDVPVPPATGIAVYRMTQEALANVAGHARASRAGVTLAYDGGELVATVEDDGRGLGPVDADPAAGPGGPAAGRPSARLGLFAMQERIGLVGGRLAVESGPERGTTVRAAIPLPLRRPAPADGEGQEHAPAEAGRPTRVASPNGLRSWGPPACIVGTSTGS
jgi:two-component system sensor histidine kinase UhpB